MRNTVTVALLAFLVAIVAGFGSLSSARADVVWCEDDPVIEINGVVVNVLVGVHDDPLLVSRHVKEAVTTIYVPKGVKTKKLGMTSKYFKEKVRFEATNAPWQAGQPVPVLAVITFDATVPLTARVMVSRAGQPPITATGSTVAPIVVPFTVQ